MVLCRKKYILRILVAIGLLFLLYQFYFVMQMGIYSKDSRLAAMKSFNSGKCIQDHRETDSPGALLRSNLSWSEFCFRQMHNTEFPSRIDECYRFFPGVLPSYQNLYETFFKCIHSGEVIPYSYVNDDYCDCSDFTDEPSTSACSDGRFFCQWQKDQNSPVSIASYKVNDGICDCCDGSDEWRSIPLPEHTIVQDINFRGVDQVPCRNSCLQQA